LRITREDIKLGSSREEKTSRKERRKEGRKEGRKRRHQVWIGNSHLGPKAISPKPFKPQPEVDKPPTRNLKKLYISSSLSMSKGLIDLRLGANRLGVNQMTGNQRIRFLNFSKAKR